MEKTLLPFIIIIDDGSDAETAQWINLQEILANVVTIRNETAQGFSKACNQGMDYAMKHYDFTCLCVLNSDAEIVTDNWFDKVEEHFEQDPIIGVAGVMSDNALAQTVKNVDRYLKTIDTKPSVFCHIIHGFCYFISKRLIETLGHFDAETFPHYGSEDDYSLKAMKAGFHNLIVGSVFVKHKAEASYSSSVRTEYLKTSLPNFQKRWGKNYVDACVRQAWEINKHLNTNHG